MSIDKSQYRISSCVVVFDLSKHTSFCLLAEARVLVVCLPVYATSRAWLAYFRLFDIIDTDFGGLGLSFLSLYVCEELVAAGAYPWHSTAAITYMTRFISRRSSSTHADH